MTHTGGRAAVISGPKQITFTEQTFSLLSPGQIRIEVEGVGVCASNLPVWEGRPWFNYPIAPGAPGHEGWGTVVESNGAEGPSVGTRVAFLSSNAFADFDVAAAESVVQIPFELDGKPFPGEALGCAMNIFRRAEIDEGATVGIVGAGFLGLLLIQLARSAGAKVFATSRRAFALEQARTAGAYVVEAIDSAGLFERVRQETGGRMCTHVIEVVGEQRALDVASSLCGERARLIIGGYHQDGLRSVNMQQWNWLGLDVINAHERDPKQYVRGIEDAIAATLEGRINPFPLLTHEFPVGQLNDAFSVLAERPDGFLKAVVLP